MARYPRKQAKRARKGAKKPYRRAGRKMAKPSLVKTIKKIMAKDIETKTVVFNSSVTAFNQQINATGDCLRLMPQITNGTAENQKIGNVIKLQSLNVRGVLTFTLSQATAANTRIGVRMLILRPKKYNEWNVGALDFGTNYTKLLEGTTTGFQGLVSQFNTPVNHDYFSVVMDKKFYMSQTLINANNLASTDLTNTTKFVNFNVPYTRNKKLIYDQDDSVSESTNFPYFMVLGYTKLDGSAADLPATAYLTFQYSATAKFEDA